VKGEVYRLKCRLQQLLSFILSFFSRLLSLSCFYFLPPFFILFLLPSHHHGIVCIILSVIVDVNRRRKGKIARAIVAHRLKEMRREEEERKTRQTREFQFRHWKEFEFEFRLFFCFSSCELVLEKYEKNLLPEIVYFFPLTQFIIILSWILGYMMMMMRTAYKCNLYENVYE
jgi:hypothetical protein